MEQRRKKKCRRCCRLVTLRRLDFVCYEHMNVSTIDVKPFRRKRFFFFLFFFFLLSCQFFFSDIEMNNLHRFHGYFSTFFLLMCIEIRVIFFPIVWNVNCDDYAQLFSMCVSDTIFYCILTHRACFGPEKNSKIYVKKIKCNV